MAWITFASVSVTNGAVTATVNSAEDISLLEMNAGLIIGELAPVAIKKAYLGAGDSKVIELFAPWPHATQANKAARVFNTDAGLPEATKALTDIVDVVKAEFPEVVTVSENITKVINVSDNISAINTANSNAANVNTVATNITNVNATGANITAVNSAATNMTAIIAAPTEAAKAKTEADRAASVLAATYTKSEIDSKDALKLNLTGGTLSGVLSSEPNSSTTYSFERLPTYAAGSKTYLRRFRGGWGDFIWHETVQQGSYRLAIGASDTVDVFHLSSDGQGFINGSKIYTTGFKPSASDVGALPITGGTLTGTLVSPRVKISSNAEGITNSQNNNMIRHGGSGSATIVGNVVEKTYIDSLGGNIVVRSGSSDLGTVYHSENLLFSKTPEADKLVQRTDTGAIAGSSFVSASDFRVTLNPKGGVYEGPSSVTGSIKITLPAAKTYTMMKLYVSVYNYANDTSFDAVISGYDAAHSVTGLQHWDSVSAVTTGGSATVNHPVYFGYEDDKACIWIGSVGSTWRFPHVVINKVETGYLGGNNDRWSSGWSVGFVTTLGTIVRTISDTLVKPKQIIAADVAGLVGTMASGAVIEAGSNANGEFVRFADGLQICTKSNTAITIDPAAFVGTATSVDSAKLKVGRWK